MRRSAVFASPARPRDGLRQIDVLSVDRDENLQQRLHLTIRSRRGQGHHALRCGQQRWRQRVNGTFPGRGGIRAIGKAGGAVVQRDAEFGHEHA